MMAAKIQLTLGGNGNDSHLVADSIAAQTQVTLFLRGSLYIFKGMPNHKLTASQKIL